MIRPSFRNPLLTTLVFGTLMALTGCRDPNTGAVPDDTYPEAVPADFEVTLERGACFGTCPVYVLTVSADGSVAFNGIRFVLAEGRFSGSLTPEEVMELYRAVVEADFFGLEDRYEVQATDLPSITTTVTLDGRMKSVYHYGLGCGSDLDLAPSGLCRVESLLEAIPVSNGWVSDP